MTDRQSAYPRTLVVTQYPFNRLHGGGISLTSYFNGWPADRLAQVYIGSPALVPDRHVCQKFYQLTDDEILPTIVWQALSLAARVRRKLVNQWRPNKKPRSDQSCSCPVSVGDAGNEKMESLPVSGFARWRNWFPENGFLESSNARISPSLLRFIDSFEPEVIFAVPGDIATIVLPRLIAEQVKCPLVIQIADDWMSHYPNRNLATRLLCSRMGRELRRTLKFASYRYSICLEMSEAFKERYGMTFEDLLGPVDLQAWQSLSPSKITSKQARITYAGTIHDVAQLQGLKDIAEAVKSLNSNSIPCRLSLVTPPDNALSHAKNFAGLDVEWMPLDDPGEVISAIKKSNVLVLPIEFDPKQGIFVRYSLPAKVSAYAASGVPMLVYGPPNTPPVRLAVREGLAAVVSDRGSDALMNTLRQLIQNQDLRNELSTKAIAYAAANHDLQSVANRFRKVLVDVLTQKGSAQ